MDLNFKEILTELVQESLHNDFTVASGGLDKVSLNFWLDPNGKLIRIPMQGHNTWAAEYMRNKPEYVEKTLRTQPQDILYLENWVKMVLYDAHGEPVLRIQYDPSVPPNHVQEKAMLDFVHDFNTNHEKKITHIQDDTRRTRKYINESMFPKDFNRHNLGSCMSAAALATTHLKSKGITEFKIVEGFVSMYPDQEPEDWSAHTWIEFNNGKKFDPTKNQWKHWGFDPKETQYEKVVRKFTPDQYEKLCQIQNPTKIDVEKFTLKEATETINERLSFADLYDETDDERIFKSKLPGMRVRSMDISTENGNETWNFNATSQEKEQYRRHGGKTSHRSRIIFFKDSVEPDDNAEDLECMVDCDCKDFQFRFAYVNAQDDASMIGPKSLNKAVNRPPIKTNPEGDQKLCKHLAALTRYLVTNLDKARQRAHLRPDRGLGGVGRLGGGNRPVNIFEAMNELANKGHDKWEYYDKDDSLNEGLERVGQDPSKQRSNMPINWNAPDLWAHTGWDENEVRHFAGLPNTFTALYRTILPVSELYAKLVEDDPTEPSEYDWSEFRIRKGGFPPIVVLRDENKKLHIMDGNHRVAYAEDVGYQTIGAWVVDKFLQKHLEKGSLQETRIITPEESLLEGYITLYHGTVWPIALKAKKGELGPQDMQKLVMNVLIDVFHETPQEAKKYYDKYVSIRRKDPSRLFLTTSRKGAEGYARSCTKWGGELFYDVISNYMYEKDQNIDREVLVKKLKTDEPAIVTINVPLEMVLTHPHWTTPLKHRLRDIMANLKKYPDIKDSLFDNFNLEVFVKDKIPARFIQRIDKVSPSDQK